MEKTDYITYTATDLLNDDYFLESEHHPTPESQLFWSRLEAEHKALGSEMQLARALLYTVTHSSGKRISEPEVAELWEQIKFRTIAKEKRRHPYLLLHRWIAAAACIIVVFVGGWMALMNMPEEEYAGIASVKRPDAQPTDEVQLILSDTRKLTIDGEDSKLLYQKGKVDINSQTIQIDENKGTTEAYNQLIVPAGKRSSITFSDGTKVCVNANTRVVYPVEFTTKRREIYVEGEVYLEVSPDKSRPFIVKTTQLDVRVLGTRFNINAYTENQNVVLVSGSVEVDTRHHSTRKLKPNEMLAYSEKELEVRTVNVANYISWINGYCIFQQESVSNVATKLSQYYKRDITISPRLKDITCSGKLNLRDSLEEVLETLAETIPAEIEKTEDGTFFIK